MDAYRAENGGKAYRGGIGFFGFIYITQDALGLDRQSL